MKKKTIATALCALLMVAAIFVISKSFFAESLQRASLVDVYFQATVYDKDGEKIYLTDKDSISLISGSTNINFKINNGAISATMPLYEYDKYISGHTVKKIFIDNNSHNVLVKENSAYIDMEPWMFEAEKDGKTLLVEMNDCLLNLEGYDGYVVKWEIKKELEQSFVSDKDITEIIVKTKDMYKKPVYEALYGDSSIVRYTAPCNHRGADVFEDDLGYYISFIMDEENAYSIAKGMVIGVDSISKSVAVKYNDGVFAVYENIIPSVVVNDTLGLGDKIGLVDGENLVLRTCDNGEWVASEWLYDDYERPDEGPNCPRMYQAGQEWSETTYGYSTIGGGGCGPSSIAMAASGLLGRVYTPKDIVDIIVGYDAPGIWYYLKGEGSTYLIFPRVCNTLGLMTETIGTSEAEIKEQLNNGKMVIISIAEGRYYKGDGHFILIRGLDSDGRFLINDSAHAFDLNTGYDYEDLKPVKSARTIYKELKEVTGL